MIWASYLSFKWIKVKVAQSCPGYSVDEILQARILEWVAISFSRGSSSPGDQTSASCLVWGFFTVWATRKSLGTIKKLRIILLLSWFIFQYLMIWYSGLGFVHSECWVEMDSTLLKTLPDFVMIYLAWCYSRVVLIGCSYEKVFKCWLIYVEMDMLHWL